MEFSSGKYLFETTLSHLDIKLDIKSDPQCNASRSNILATEPFYPKYDQT